MNLFDRIRRGIEVGTRAFKANPDFQQVSKALDVIIEEKQDHESKLDVRNTTRDLTYINAYRFLRNLAQRGEDLATYGSLTRDEQLSELWKIEPILAGAVYSMTAKMTSLSWAVTGRRRIAKGAAEIFATAAHIDGYDWGGFISSTAQDFYTTDRGVFWETPRDGYGRLSDIGHIDSLCCDLTGNKLTPMVYSSEVLGQQVRFKQGEYVHFSSLPSSRERYFGIGFCAVSRAFKAARLLIGLHEYDHEKLNNLPPEGIAAVTGLTMDEFNDAVTLWMEKRKQDNSLTFPQVLWLLGSQPNVEVKVALQGFSQLPESFDRKSVVDQYVSTLALDFGVDAREFWPISSGALGTASETEVQHQKARGKGPGEFITITERHLNAELPDDADFRYDTQDIEEDINAANSAKLWIDALWVLYAGIPNPSLPPPMPGALGGGLGNMGGTPKPPAKPGDKAGQQPNEPAGWRRDRVQAKEDPAQSGKQDKQTEQVLEKDDLIRLLVDKGILPEYLAQDERIAVRDTEIHIGKEGHPEDYTCFKFEKGILKETRLPPIILNSLRSTPARLPEPEHEEPDYIDATVLNDLQKKEQQILNSARKITGEPIPESEVKRGSRVTAKAIKAELERWRQHPILSKYAPTEEEETALLQGMTR